MISFFRAYDPIRIIAIFIVLLFIRIPFLFLETNIPNLQIDLMNVGARLANGFMMYRDTWDTLEPFAAGFYWLVNLCFGKSFLVTQLLSILIIYFQSIYISIIFNLDNVYDDRTMVPSYIYILLASSFVDFFYVSPLMLGITFLLPVFHWMFINLKITTKEELFYLSGIFIGIASLFQFYLSVFIIWLLIYLMVFIKPNFRVYFLVIIGFFFPYLIVYLYFFMAGIENPLERYLQIFNTGSVKESMMTLRSLIIIGLPSLTIFLIGVFYTLSNTRYINFQYNVIKIMMLYFIITIAILFYLPNPQPSSWLITIPAIAYFGGNFFHYIKYFWFSEFPMLMISLLLIMICYGSIHPSINKYLRINTSYLLAKKEERYKYLEHKKILLLGANRAPYIYADPCTPYINWKFSKSLFQSKRDYEKISEI
ncbi:MAG: hypothetical protein EAZ07_05550 [Cytophagales bacterium]|nr:MAG: hypothetical protein EAZ07_05550 [Cytophagales bacterium]